MEVPVRGAANGSSPRVRSRRQAQPLAVSPVGIISACAEQTEFRPRRRGFVKDHLRVCGADGLGPCQRFGEQGSSPRVRSRLHHAVVGVFGAGIISACAEQTAVSSWSVHAMKDHLRVCGADSCILLWFGLVGCRGIFDSCTAWGRKTTWIPIFGIDVLGLWMFLWGIGEPSPCTEFWSRLHWLHCVSCPLKERSGCGVDGRRPGSRLANDSETLQHCPR